MISYYGAIKKIENEFRKLILNSEKAGLLDLLNRIAAENIYADSDQPSFTNSAMDGYAIKYSKGINEWKIIGEIRAGGNKNIKIEKGEAVEIMTGAMLPKGADTVVPLENASIRKSILNLVNNSHLRKGEFVRFKGENVKKRQLLIRKKTLLNSRNITMAGACGKKSLRVFRKLKIGVIATGDELVDIDVKPEQNKVRASNLYSLISAIEQMNMIPVSFGIAGDKKFEIKKRLKTALDSGIDILMTTGGVSAGKYDILKEVFCELEVKVRFSGVNIKPGKPLVFGIYEKQGNKVLVYGLPGNPVSCHVNFILFVRNVIMKMYLINGDKSTSAILNHDLTKSDNKSHFLRGIIHNKSGINFVSQIGSQSSANIVGLNSANCLIVQKEKQMILRKGSPVECIVI